MNRGPQYKRQAEKDFTRARDSLRRARETKAFGDDSELVAIFVQSARMSNRFGVRQMRSYLNRASRRRTDDPRAAY